MQEKLNESLGDLEEGLPEPSDCLLLYKVGGEKKFYLCSIKRRHKKLLKRDPKAQSEALPTELKYTYLEKNKMPFLYLHLLLLLRVCLLEVLKRCKKAIGWQISDLKGISPLVCTHHIYMEEEAKPIRQPQRRLNPHMQEVVRAEVLKLLQAGIIYPISDSLGKIIFHCHLLIKCWRESQAILSIVSWTLLGYFQIEIDVEDQEKTTFTCPFGTYAYRRMPFGLCNAPATFQRCMLSIFSDMVERIMEVFMDDITIYGSTFEECLVNLEAVLNRCIEKTWCSTGRNAILWYTRNCPWPYHLRERH
ncbi:Retrovirus-related Pol polyprotein from transposon 17.6 [Vitis vinifera]|uniref:Retrovirus-related Pol polyprotein from transposon 17.6 n=1 Tax=Vitis vinifera TaxID=29760 RepID=A0A438GAL0_VITVI|nr:Retrovirus-related Pol polyprotein from transposon 17.6 [Vitis vinifera]